MQVQERQDPSQMKLTAEMITIKNRASKSKVTL